jgi:hypothetical protein
MLFWILVGTCCLANAQVFKVEAGSSTLFDAQGGSLEFRSGDYSGDIGAGLVNGEFHYGASVERKLFGTTVKVGDDQVRLQLPTDVFDSSHYFLVRGIGLSRSSDENKVFVFAGATSQGFSTPFFSASGRDDAMGALFYETHLSQRLRFISHNVFAQRQTSLQSLEWSMRDGLTTAVSVGTGNNARYAATSVAVQRTKFELKGAYVSQGPNFKRLHAPDTEFASEVEGANLSFTYRPRKGMSVTATHQNIVQPAFLDESTQRATVNELLGTALVAKINIGSGLFTSRVLDRSTLGTMLFASRTLNSRLSVGANYYRSTPDDAAATNLITGNVRVGLTQRISVVHILSYSQGQLSNGFGGDITANRFNAHVDYQTVFVPLRIDNPFQQALGFNIGTNLPLDLRVAAGSNVGPDGRVRYTFGLTRFFYHTGTGPAPAVEAYHFGKYVIRGTVVDESSQPVAGAAIQIGKEEVFSDTEGKFLLRLNKRSPASIAINFDDFLVVGHFETVQVPSSIMSELEEKAPEARLVLRRVRHAGQE